MEMAHKLEYENETARCRYEAVKKFQEDLKRDMKSNDPKKRKKAQIRMRLCNDGKSISCRYDESRGKYICF